MCIEQEITFLFQEILLFLYIFSLGKRNHLFSNTSNGVKCMKEGNVVGSEMGKNTTNKPKERKKIENQQGTLQTFVSDKQ